MSRSTFASEFAHAFGSTPMAFVREVRLRNAAALLRSGDLSVAAVAATVGFSGRSHFSRLFRDHFGITPSGFRRRPDESR
jgi:AraC-like DNA-binding protein